MAEKPIIFSGPMVRALIEGRKTMTRRVLKPQPEHLQVYNWRGKRLHDSEYRHWCWNGHVGEYNWDEITTQLKPYLPYAIGDRLWVREAWADVNSECGPGWAYRADGEFIQPEYDGENFGAGPSFNYDKYPGIYSMWYSDLMAGAVGHSWRSPIHMPRWASRLTLIVTDVRVERLQDITPDDCYEEGAKCDMSARTVIDHFRNLWDSLNAKRGYPWESNPWVCAVSFDVVNQNIDALDRGAG